MNNEQRTHLFSSNFINIAWDWLTSQPFISLSFSLLPPFSTLTFSHQKKRRGFNRIALLGLRSIKIINLLNSFKKKIEKRQSSRWRNLLKPDWTIHKYNALSTLLKVKLRRRWSVTSWVTQMEKGERGRSRHRMMMIITVELTDFKYPTNYYYYCFFWLHEIMKWLLTNFNSCQLGSTQRHNIREQKDNGGNSIISL